MCLSYHGTAGLSAGLSSIRHTLDALKRSAKVLFEAKNEWHTSFRASKIHNSPVEWPYVGIGEFSTTHLSGVAIAAALGLSHIHTEPPTPLPVWLLPSLRHALSTHYPSPAFPSPYESDLDLDLDLDLEAIPGDGAPTRNSRTPTLLAHLSDAPSICTFPAPHTRSSDGQSMSTTHIPAGESPSTSTASTPYASSSSADSDSSFEVASPAIGAAGHPINVAPQSSDSDGLSLVSNFAQEGPLISSNSDSFSRRLEAEVLALAHRLSEEACQKAQKQAPQSVTAVRAADIDEVNTALESDLLTDDCTADETGVTTLGAGHYEPEDDYEGAAVLSSPYTGERYILEGVVAKGGSGRVVRAVDSKGNRRAVKMVLKPKIFEWQNARGNLLREKNIMARVAGLDTWRLAYLYESWEDEDMIYFVMEHSPCSLHFLISPPASAPRIGLTEEDECLLCAEMIAALSVLHENEIVHRDIKPDNFLVDPAGGAVLADFGLSLEIDLYGVINGVCGTMDYLAPEQWRGSSYDSQVDIWQLGCTFIELFARLRGTWIGTFGKGNNPLSRVDLSLDELQEVLDRSVEELLPEGHPGKDLVLMMIKSHPGERATVEELKVYPWFDGMNWDEVTYGPTAERSFKPHNAPINLYASPAYSTYFDNPSESQRSPEVEEAVQMQMAMYEVEPFAFVYPPLEACNST